MTETQKKYSLLEQEYTAFIQNLIAAAVAVPIESYRQATLSELGQSASVLREAGTALGRHLDEAGERMKLQIKPLFDAIEEIGFRLDSFSAQELEKAASANGLHDSLANIKERLVAIESSYADGLSSLRSEVAGLGADFNSRSADTGMLAKLLKDIDGRLQPLEGSVASLTKAVPDIPLQLEAQRTEAEKLGALVADLHTRLNRQVQALTAELKRSSEGTTAAAINVVKEAETRLGGQVEELGARAGEQLERLEELARRLDVLHSEAARADAVLSSLTQIEQSLGRLISENVEAAVTLLKEEQSGTAQKMVEEFSASRAESRESAELTVMMIEESRKSAAAASSQLNSELKNMYDAHASSLVDLGATQTLTQQELGAVRALLNELAGGLGQTHKQLTSLGQRAAEQEARLTSVLKTSEKSMHQQLQRLAAELTKEFARQGEQGVSQAARHYSSIEHHVADLRTVISSSADRLHVRLNNSIELSTRVGREGADARTALEKTIARVVKQQQEIKRSVKMLSWFTVFANTGITILLLYLLFR